MRVYCLCWCCVCGEGLSKPKKKAAPFDERRFFTWLRSGLRSMSRRYPPIYEALAAAKEPYVGDNVRQKFAYRCAACDGVFPAKMVAVDHRVDCGSLTSWQDVVGFMERLFCKKEGLDILCHSCHDCKTYQTKYNVTREEAVLQKATIALIKEKTPKQLLAYLKENGYGGASVSNSEKRKQLVYEILKGE